MNNMVKLEKDLFNRKHILYIEEDLDNLKLTIYTNKFNKYSISYVDSDSFLKDIKSLRGMDFVEIENILLDLDKVLTIRFYKDVKENNYFMHVVFISNNDEIVKVFELNKMSYDDEPESIRDDIMLNSIYICKGVIGIC